MSPRLARTATLAALALALTTASAHAATPSAYVYATSWSQNVRQYAADDAGLLSPLTPATAPAGNSSSGAAATPDGRHLYVVNQGSDSVSQYDVGLDGTLTPKAPATVAAADGAFGAAMAPDGRHLYVADQNAAAVSVFDIDDDGALTLAATAPAGAGALQVAVTPDGASAYVTNLTAGTVSQYDVAADGSLTPKTPATVATPSPTGVTVTPDGRSAYVANRTNPGTISQYDIASDGTLTPKTPATVAAGVQPVAVAATDGSVYATNFGANSISQYDVDADGALSPKSPATVAGPRNPWGLVVSPDGESLYVAAFSDAAVAQYDIGAGGALAPKDPAAVTAGFRPIAVAAVAPRDETDPTIDLRMPTDGAEYAIGDRVVADYSCADEGGSGLESCDGDVPSGEPLDTLTPGDHQFTVTARDRAGNTATVTHTYRVVLLGGGLPFGGFLGPILDGDAVKAGRTIPIVFSLGGDRGPDVLAEGSPTSGPVDCDAPGAPEDTEPVDTPSGLRFNPRTEHYVFWWTTDRAWAGTCRAFVLTLADGSVHRLTVKFRPSCRARHRRR